MSLYRPIALFACPSRGIGVTRTRRHSDHNRQVSREVVRGVAVDCYIRGLDSLGSDLEALADGPDEPTTTVYRSVVQRHWRWGEISRARYHSLLRTLSLSPEPQPNASESDPGSYSVMVAR